LISKLITRNQWLQFYSLNLRISVVNKAQFTFLKDRLYTFKFYIDNDYSMESEIEYNELLGNLLIKITIIIPEKRMLKDLEKCMEIIMNKINSKTSMMHKMKYIKGKI